MDANRLSKLLSDVEDAREALDDVVTAIRSEDADELRRAGLVLERVGCYARRTGAAG